MKRHALFVGVNRYDDKFIRPLRFALPDATILADRFGRAGFETRLLADPTQAELKNAVEAAVSELLPGDIFLFFYAGHGFTAQDGAHLLFCKDDRVKLLRGNGAGIRVDTIERLSEKQGVHRAFLLDSCRTDSLADIDARGASSSRDLDFVHIPKGEGSFFLLRSCNRFQPSIEIESLQHGLFTKSLVDAIDARDLALMKCGTDFAEALGHRMDAYAREYGCFPSQRPSSENEGPAFSLFMPGFFPSLNQKQRVTPEKSRPAASATPRIKSSFTQLPKAGERRTFKISDNVSMDFVWCPATTSDEWKKIANGASTFLMGSDIREPQRKADEFLHPVKLSHGFWIATTPVMQIQWEGVLGAKANKSPRPRGAEKPVTCVAYDDAMEFIRKIRDFGCPVGLPTEAQWEYACRAGKNGQFGAGETGFFVPKYKRPGYLITGDDFIIFAIPFLGWIVAWIAACFFAGKTAPLKLFPANNWGIYDMHGNCGEWCSDWYGPYAASEVTDPRGPDSGRGHVVRGMRGVRFACLCRSASRWWIPAQMLFGKYRHPLVGLRLVINSFDHEGSDPQCLMSENAKSAPQDHAATASGYRKAADQGDADAQFNLGMMYANGRGVSRDDVEAVKWYRKAAEQGHARAQYNLGVRYDNGRGVSRDNGEAAKWYRKAAEQGYAAAQFNLGYDYEHGEGVPCSNAEALKWYRKAAEQGHENAKNALKRFGR